MNHDLKEEGHPVTPHTFFIRNLTKMNVFNFRKPKIDYKLFREFKMTSSMASRSNRNTIFSIYMVCGSHKSKPCQITSQNHSMYTDGQNRNFTHSKYFRVFLTKNIQQKFDIFILSVIKSTLQTTLHKGMSHSPIPRNSFF